MFLPQCCRLADLALGAPGTDLTLRLGHGLLHDWPLMPVPEGPRTMLAAMDFLAAAS
ncbi:unannotated protein [freshwater metagenome]|uniref:Unannotated protein n=1 Tax=freshwater metagenome TaxID=449393 RepID=A0A6J6NYN3_9ZZZZ